MDITAERLTSENPQHRLLGAGFGIPNYHPENMVKVVEATPIVPSHHHNARAALMSLRSLHGQSHMPTDRAARLAQLAEERLARNPSRRDPLPLNLERRLAELQWQRLGRTAVDATSITARPAYTLPFGRLVSNGLASVRTAGSSLRSLGATGRQLGADIWHEIPREQIGQLGELLAIGGLAIWCTWGNVRDGSAPGNLQINSTNKLQRAWSSIRAIPGAIADTGRFIGYTTREAAGVVRPPQHTEADLQPPIYPTRQQQDIPKEEVRDIVAVGAKPTHRPRHIGLGPQAQVTASVARTRDLLHAIDEPRQRDEVTYRIALDTFRGLVPTFAAPEKRVVPELGPEAGRVMLALHTGNFGLFADLHKLGYHLDGTLPHLIDSLLAHGATEFTITSDVLDAAADFLQERKAQTIAKLAGIIPTPLLLTPPQTASAEQPQQHNTV